MKHAIPKPDAHQTLREALRDMCQSFDSKYWQEVDEARGYPEAFAQTLTEAGWLAALIPTEYGGSGLGLAEASVMSRPKRAESVCSARPAAGRRAKRQKRVRGVEAARARRRWAPPTQLGFSAENWGPVACVWA